MFLSLLCNLGAIGGYSTGVFGSVLFAAVVVMSAPTQKKHRTKNSATRIAPKLHRRRKDNPHIEVSEVYTHIHGYIIVF